jgi:hypothetical protein
VTNPPRVCSAESEIGKYDPNDDNKADDINNGIHGFFSVDIGKTAPCINRSIASSEA